MSRKSKILEDLFVIAFLVWGMGWTPFVWSRMAFAIVLLLYIIQPAILWVIDEYRKLKGYG